MQLNKADQKAQAILKAIAAGRSCEQILAADPTLSYHDIFHSVSEAPTSQWRKNRAKAASKPWLRFGGPPVKPVQQRID